MKAVLLFLTAIHLFGQSGLLSPTADFDLNAGLKSHKFRRNVRSYFAATPNGLTLVTISYNHVSLTSADLDGRILHSKSDLASVNAQAYAALPRRDGSVWLVSSGPYNFTGTVTTDPIGGRATTRIESYNDLDLYSPSGEHLGSLRLLSTVSGLESPIAAADDRLVLRSTHSASSESELVHFGTVLGGQFKERTLVRLAPPVTGDIAALASTGELILIDKKSGSIVIVDPKTKSSAVVQTAKPYPVRAAAVDSNFLYLLSAGAVLKMDLAGQFLSSYRLQFSPGFAPVSLGVTGNLLYLVDRAGHTERFQIP